jgi:hypothetical protein
LTRGEMMALYKRIQGIKADELRSAGWIRYGDTNTWVSRKIEYGGACYTLDAAWATLQRGGA